jgi:hypothetical protein
LVITLLLKDTIVILVLTYKENKLIKLQSILIITFIKKF